MPAMPSPQKTKVRRVKPSDGEYLSCLRYTTISTTIHRRHTHGDACAADYDAMVKELTTPVPHGHPSDAVEFSRQSDSVTSEADLTNLLCTHVLDPHARDGEAKLGLLFNNICGHTAFGQSISQAQPDVFGAISQDSVEPTVASELDGFIRPNKRSEHFLPNIMIEIKRSNGKDPRCQALHYGAIAARSVQATKEYIERGKRQLEPHVPFQSEQWDRHARAIALTFVDGTVNAYLVHISPTEDSRYSNPDDKYSEAHWYYVPTWAAGADMRNSTDGHNRGVAIIRNAWTWAANQRKRLIDDANGVARALDRQRKMAQLSSEVHDPLLPIQESQAALSSNPSQPKRLPGASNGDHQSQDSSPDYGVDSTPSRDSGFSFSQANESDPDSDTSYTGISRSSTGCIRINDRSNANSGQNSTSTRRATPTWSLRSSTGACTESPSPLKDASLIEPINSVKRAATATRSPSTRRKEKQLSRKDRRRKRRS